MKRTKKTKVAFTDAEKRFVQAAALAVWQYVGGDLLASVAAGQETPVDDVAIPRDEVIEIVADAGRLEEQLKADARAAAKARRDLAEIDFDALVAKVGALDYAEVKRLLRPAFPYARYGA